ncbi:selenium-dependent xanthine dehydrogenase [Paramaledivibacter caminithermalis]|jgi:selenium-dependent xanthine dehydrogenase|uniref:Selenium-dependent xanthine dehydrogenase n=1 Tax=Paramaledivibacter caminithermalis (strain DSM 15212 / CIP 107654 / DViRD3) TaxID=1121301 RepID=A0A1M6K8F1_PARC5|nr:selenium-dependent xanthine dehydrogenase [Paramaledivibacter caminithermalis]SHJ55258.1 selenium-dependent xanthine dehydrogenase [Paramaledivibacter caminithermalis DSM 15212]
MFKIKVNGKEYQSEKDMKLIDFLRDELGIMSVKNGCKEGACGTCTVLIDGKAVRSCVQKLSRLKGKEIQTIEGFTEREKKVFSYAFAKAGAVQCGFCTPGMIIASKALINKNPDPSREDVKNAIRNNICRCTGYNKIEEAILLAAKFFRENLEIPKFEDAVKVGKKIFRIDAIPKALAEAKFADDYMFEGMLYGKNVFSKYPRAKVLSIDTSKALEMPGVVAVFIAKDIPGNRYIGHIAQDWPGMIDVGEETKCIGDTLAIVVAEAREQAEKAAKAVEVEYEVLKPVTNPEEAMKPDAPQIHGEGFMQFGKFRIPKNNLFDYEKVKRGDAEAALKKSKYVVEGTFYVPPTEHAFMEPETAVGLPDGDGIKVITGDQGIYDDKREIANYLGIPEEKVRIQSAFIGGGFGGKEDMSVQHQAALCAYLLKRPVKVYFSRQESINYHPKRHSMKIYCKIGCDENGILQGMKARFTSDTGAYASLGGPVLQRACTHAGGPYNYKNVDIEGYAYYTNNPPAGAFRGFGVTQSVFVVESLINQLAEKAGFSEWEIRYRNAIRPGQVLPNGQIADEGTAMVETLEAVKEEFEKYKNNHDYYVGIASAMKNSGRGVGLPDPGRCNLKIIQGKVHARSSAATIGQGVQTVILQMICETTGLTLDKIVVEQADTKYTPDAGTTTASRQTVFTGEAARKASLELKADLEGGKTLEDLEGKEYIGEFDFKTDPIGSDKPNPVSHIAYGYATQLVIIDKEGKLVKVVAAHDVGRVVNPLSIEGQVEGGVVMSLGYALTEDFPLKDGVPQVKFGTLGLLKAHQIPPIEMHFIEKNDPNGVAYGAKGIGEIAAIPAAPAVQNAYYKKDGVFRYKLPLENTYYRRTKIQK